MARRRKLSASSSIIRGSVRKFRSGHANVRPLRRFRSLSQENESGCVPWGCCVVFSREVKPVTEITPQLLRGRAARYRVQADVTVDPAERAKLLDMAAIYEREAKVMERDQRRASDKC